MTFLDGAASGEQGAGRHPEDFAHPGSGGAAARVKAAARAQGFEAVGICDLRPVERDALAKWLAQGYVGTMTYMTRQAKKRKEPGRIVPGAKRAIVVVKNYFQGAGSGEQGAGASGGGSEPEAHSPAVRVARYAWGERYHLVLGEKLAQVTHLLLTMGSSPACTRWYVDAGPVPERELAQRAGLGWIAKNTMLIHPKLGSFTFIGTILTDLELEVDTPFEADRCGSCRRCLDACPTAAFPSEYVLDATRCISYLTIEYRGPFDAGQGAMIGDWLFGCDICQDVCPWNIKFGSPTDEPRFSARAETTLPHLAALASIDQPHFQKSFGDTAFERTGARGIARNARQVLANQRRTTSCPTR